MYFIFNCKKEIMPGDNLESVRSYKKCREEVHVLGNTGALPKKGLKVTLNDNKAHLKVRKELLKKYQDDYAKKRTTETVVSNPNDKLLWGLGPQKEEWSEKIDERTELKWKGVTVGGVKFPTDQIEYKFTEDHFSSKTAKIKKISTEHTLSLKRLGIDEPDYDLFLGGMQLPASLVTGLEAGYETATKFETDNLQVVIKPGAKVYAQAEARLLAQATSLSATRQIKGAVSDIEKSENSVKGATRIDIGVQLSFGIEIFKLVDNKMRAQGMFSITLGFSFLAAGTDLSLPLVLSEKDVNGEKMAYISMYLKVAKYIGFEALAPYATIEGAFNKAIFIDKNDDGIKSFLMGLIFSSEKNIIIKAVMGLLPSQEYLGLRVASLRGVPMAPNFENLTTNLRASREYLWSGQLDEGNSSYLRSLEELNGTLNRQHELLYNKFINEKYPYKTVAELPSNLAKDDHDSAQWIFYGRKRLGTFCKRSIRSLEDLTAKHKQHLEAIKRDVKEEQEIDLTQIPPLVREELFTWMYNNTIQLGETNGMIDKEKLVKQLENAISRQEKFKIKLEEIFNNKLLYGELDKGDIKTQVSNSTISYTLATLGTNVKNLVNYDRYNRVHTLIQQMRSQRNYMENEMEKIINNDIANMESKPEAMYIFKMFKAYIRDYSNIDLKSLEKDLSDPARYKECMNLINLERNNFQRLVDSNNQRFKGILNDPSTTPQTKNYFNRLQKMLNSNMLNELDPKLPVFD